MKILLAWIGLTDVRASENNEEAGLGPIGQVLQSRKFDHIILLDNLNEAQSKNYQQWLANLTETPFEIRSSRLSGPTEFGEIYQTVIETISEIRKRFSPEPSLTFHLSPGTPAMAAVWIIVSKTRFTAELIESSKQAGVRTVSIPFEINAQFIPDLIRQSDKQLEKAANEFSAAKEFGDIIHESIQMRELIELAQTVALHDIPVLIEGESGTGKELFAKAIHRSSPRKSKPFIAVNCGAIPSELIESELFGHNKGAFTGAEKDRKGVFEEAEGGTIFLDEIGEMPIRAQVRLLRVLQEKQIVRVGDTKPKDIDVRIISATNRNLSSEISKGNFREDLFYRLAVFPLYLPPLREREGDLLLLIRHFLEKLNNESTGTLWKTDKILDSKAEKSLLNHQWTGNVRELQNTILRLCILTKESLITEKDVDKALLIIKERNFETILNRPLESGFSLQQILGEVARHYLKRALEKAHQNKTKAAKLVDLPNYQTFDNWLEKFGIKDELSKERKL